MVWYDSEWKSLGIFQVAVTVLSGVFEGEEKNTQPNFDKLQLYRSRIS